MRTELQDPIIEAESPPTPSAPKQESRWNLAFVGMLGYAVVEYMRLPAQYPFWQALEIGKVVIGLSFLGWLISPHFSWGDRRPVRVVDLVLALLVVASFVSACFAHYHDDAWATMADLLRWILIYFLVGRVLNNGWRLRWFTFLLILLNLKMAQFGIRGYFAGRAFGRSEAFMAAHGSGAGSVGFFGNAGDFGVAMCVIWPLAAMLILGEKKLIMRVMLYVSLIIFVAAIFTSSSRGALVAMVITALAAWARNPKRILGVGIIGLILAGSLYWLPEAQKQRLQSALHPEKDRTASIRLEHWAAGLRMFEGHPLLGVGPGNYAPLYLDEHPSADTSDLVLAAHSIYIQSLSELGLAGTLPLGLLAFFLVRLNRRTRSLLKDLGDDGRKRFEYRLSMGLDLSLLGFLLSGAFLTVLYYPHLWILLGLSVAAYTSAARAVGVESDSTLLAQPELPRWGPLSKEIVC
jgi:O-antigen ligase